MENGKLKDKNSKLVYFGMTAAATLFAISMIKKNEIINKVWDAVSEARISALHPAIRDKARQLLNLAEQQGIKLRITSGFRSFADQNKLYAQGRTAPGNIVTNAQAGQSFHNYGVAFDVVPMIGTSADWNSPHWNKIGQIGKSIGFEWGGDFKTIIDKPHFQMTFGKTHQQLLALYNQGKKDSKGYVMV